MPTIDIGSTQLNVVNQGSGPILLLVHGFPLSHAMWQTQIEVFSQTHDVIAPDLRGFGGSPVTTGTVTMEQFADDLSALLDHLHVNRPVILCGLSMGGYIAFQFARKYADRLQSLVLCDTKSAADTPEAVMNRHKMVDLALGEGARAVADAMLPKLIAADTLKRHPHVADSLRKIIEGTDPQAIAAALRGMAERPDSTDLLKSIAVPTLVIVGQHDALAPPDEMEKIVDAVPDSRFLIVPDAGHMTPMENPEVFDAGLAEFLAEV